jgi:hypothetical protein
MIRVTQTFEFAAAHRLHCPDLSDERPRDLRQVQQLQRARAQLSIRSETWPGSGCRDGVRHPPAAAGEIVKRAGDRRLDHKNLNVIDRSSSVESVGGEYRPRDLGNAGGGWAPARLDCVACGKTGKEMPNTAQRS